MTTSKHAKNFSIYWPFFIGVILMLASMVTVGQVSDNFANLVVSILSILFGVSTATLIVQSDKLQDNFGLHKKKPIEVTITRMVFAMFMYLTAILLILSSQILCEMFPATSVFLAKLAVSICVFSIIMTFGVIFSLASSMKTDKNAPPKPPEIDY